MGHLMLMRKLRDHSFFRMTLVIPAGPSLETFFFLCCFIDHYPVRPIVTLCCDRHGLNSCFCRPGFITEHLFASAAGPVFLISGLRAGRFIRFRMHHLMTLRGDHHGLNSCFCRTGLITEHLSASAAGPVFLVSGLCAGRFIRFRMHHLMPQRCDRHFFDSCLFCSGLITEHLFASAAGPVFLISGLRAGRFIRFRMHHLMTLRGDHHGLNSCFCRTGLITEHLSASAAGPVFLVSGLCAGRFIRFRMHHLMPQRCDRHFFDSCLFCSGLITEHLFASAAGPVFFVSGLRAGRVLRFGFLQVVYMRTAEFQFIVGKVP